MGTRRAATLLLAFAAGCSEPSPRTTPLPALPPRDVAVAYLDNREVWLSEVAQDLLDRDYSSTVRAYIARRLLAEERSHARIANAPGELLARARREVEDRREKAGAEWPTYLQGVGVAGEDELVQRWSRARWLDEQFGNEKLFAIQLARAGHSVVRMAYFQDAGRREQPAEVIERLKVSSAMALPFVSEDGARRLSGASPGDRLELAPAVVPGVCVADVLERRAPEEIDQAEAARRVLEDPPDAHDLGLWIGGLLERAYAEGRIRYETRPPPED